METMPAHMANDYCSVSFYVPKMYLTLIEHQSFYLGNKIGQRKFPDRSSALIQLIAENRLTHSRGPVQLHIESITYIGTIVFLFLALWFWCSDLDPKNPLKLCLVFSLKYFYFTHLAVALELFDTYVT